MKIFQYCLKEYFKYVVGTVVLTIFLFILFDFIHKTTKYFAEYNPSPGDIFLFYVFQIPNQVVQALPIGSLLGGVISMVLLNRTNEITAMRAVGLGPIQLAKPLIAGGLLVSLISMSLNEFLVPRYAKKVNYIQSIKIEKKGQGEQMGSGKWVRDGNRFIHWKEFDGVNSEILKVQVLIMDLQFNPRMVLESDRAYFDEGLKSWQMSEALVNRIQNDRSLGKSEFLKVYALDLPVEPLKLNEDTRKSNELSLGELKETIFRGERSGANVVPFKMDYQGKFAYPFAALVVSLIGLKFGYKSERTADTAKGVLMAFFVGISYWVILSAGRAMGLRGDLHPFIAAWLPNISVATLIGVDGWLAQRSQK